MSFAKTTGEALSPDEERVYYFLATSTAHRGIVAKMLPGEIANLYDSFTPLVPLHFAEAG